MHHVIAIRYQRGHVLAWSEDFKCWASMSAEPAKATAYESEEAARLCVECHKRLGTWGGIAERLAVMPLADATAPAAA